MSSAVKVAFAGVLGGFRLDAAFEVPAVGVTALFGPSGCGKTTMLRCIAGLHRLARGYCAVEGDVWQDGADFRPAHRRAVGYVFQEASLFAHLSVRRNLRFARRATGSIGFDDVVGMLGLEPLLERSPLHLSGGERQRVAIGRALLSQPKLLLMDEPLSALDRATKAEVMPLLLRLNAEVSLPIIYVTHDMPEVEQLADHLVLMRDGTVTASGPLAAVQSNPGLPLALNKDAAVSIDGVVSGFDGAHGLVHVSVAGVTFLVPSSAAKIGERRRLRVAARDVSLARDLAASTIVNALEARIVSIAEAGTHELLVSLQLGEGGPLILSRVTTYSWHRLELRVGQPVYAQVKGIALS